MESARNEIESERFEMELEQECMEILYIDIFELTIKPLLITIKRCRANNVPKKWSNIKKRYFGQGSFLTNCKVLITKFLWVVRMWAHNQLGIASFLSISLTTSANMTKSFRKICSWKLSTHNLTSGGPEIIIQIDESVISRAMHNRGHDLLRPQRWVLGMYEATL
ncbi:hypothetical protein RF11_14428 [Thelohanellus kitauei]|uniref:Uncharacterized protein n=1 Tax=Thelohanellus kitauei TaxID=669202 RepID=A0A0C2MU93_THEKT|nr:hypothetical protein RF11_14428 [Thelohanellus kitauei]